MADGQAQAFPDGVHQGHVEKGGGWNRHSSVVSLVLLTALLATALSGVLGGRPSPLRSVAMPAALLEVRTPEVLRNGMFFETEIRVVPRRPVAKLVIAVDRALWRDLTVNTMIPAASEETFADGRFRFDYGPAASGKAVVMKVDSQINPSLVGGTGGNVSVYDGETLLAELPIEMKVRP